MSVLCATYYSFWTHSLLADCSFDYFFLPYSVTSILQINCSHLVLVIRCWNKLNISRATWALVFKNWGPSFFFNAWFGFSNIFYTSGIEMSQQFQGPFGPLVVTFCRPLPNFEGDCPRIHLISTPTSRTMKLYTKSVSHIGTPGLGHIFSQTIQKEMESFKGNYVWWFTRTQTT